MIDLRETYICSTPPPEPLESLSVSESDVDNINFFFGFLCFAGSGSGSCSGFDGNDSDSIYNLAASIFFAAFVFQHFQLSSA